MAAIPLALCFLTLPVVIAILTFLPLYAVGLQMLANVVGAMVYAKEFDERLPWWVVRADAVHLPPVPVAARRQRAAGDRAPPAWQGRVGEDRAQRRAPPPAAQPAASEAGA